MTNREYGEYIKQISPKSRHIQNMLRAFVSGGALCCVGQAFYYAFGALGVPDDMRGTAVSISMVALGVLLTGIGVYDRMAKFAGAGTLVPITGFANAVASPALEFKNEGLITGTAAKMFSIAGPVIVYGTAASVIYGIILYAWQALAA